VRPSAPRRRDREGAFDFEPHRCFACGELNQHGLHLAILALFAGLIAPVCEELLFRGLLLRALQRRFSPVIAVAVSALVFALAHPALDPTWGTFAIVPALFALGAISGAVAVRRADLSASIMLHIGFNFLTTFTAVVEGVRHH